MKSINDLKEARDLILEAEEAGLLEIDNEGIFLDIDCYHPEDHEDDKAPYDLAKEKLEAWLKSRAVEEPVISSPSPPIEKIMERMTPEEVEDMEIAKEMAEAIDEEELEIGKAEKEAKEEKAYWRAVEDQELD